MTPLALTPTPDPRLIPSSGDGSSLDVVAFGQIALPTQELDVSIGVTATFRHRNDVIKLQVGIGATLCTASTVLLPNTLPHLSRDSASAALVIAGNDRLIRSSYGYLPDGYWPRACGKLIVAGRLAAAANLNAVTDRMVCKYLAMAHLGGTV